LEEQAPIIKLTDSFAREFTQQKYLMAYIVDCCRTASGKKGGRLSQMHVTDLGATVIDALIDRNPSIEKY
jgi:hypothetical protein